MSPSICQRWMNMQRLLTCDEFVIQCPLGEFAFPVFMTLTCFVGAAICESSLFQELASNLCMKLPLLFPTHFHSACILFVDTVKGHLTCKWLLHANISAVFSHLSTECFLYFFPFFSQTGSWFLISCFSNKQFKSHWIAHGCHATDIHYPFLLL